MVTRAKELETILSLGVGLLTLNFVFNARYLVIASLIILSGGLIFPWFRKTVHIVWVRFTRIIGNSISKIILTIIFFIILTPLALLRRSLIQIQNRDDEIKQTNFSTRNHKYLPKDFENTW